MSGQIQRALLAQLKAAVVVAQEVVGAQLVKPDTDIAEWAAGVIACPDPYRVGMALATADPSHLAREFGCGTLGYGLAWAVDADGVRVFWDAPQSRRRQIWAPWERVWAQLTHASTEACGQLADAMDARCVYLRDWAPRSGPAWEAVSARLQVSVAAVWESCRPDQRRPTPAERRAPVQSSLLDLIGAAS